MITEEEKKEAAYNYLKANFEYSRENSKRRKKIVFWFAFVIVAIIIFLYSIKGIYLPYYVGYQRYYDVRINDIQLSTLTYMPEYTLIKNFIYMHPSTGVAYAYFQAPKKGIILYDTKYLLSIQPYSCYFSKIQVNCDENNDELIMKQKNDTKYNKLRIYSYKNFEDIYSYGSFPENYSERDEFYNLIYDDKFTDDLTQLIVKQGQYIIEVEVRYGFQIQNIAFIVLNDGNNITLF